MYFGKSKKMYPNARVFSRFFFQIWGGAKSKYKTPTMNINIDVIFLFFSIYLVSISHHAFLTCLVTEWQ